VYKDQGRLEGQDIKAVAATASDPLFGTGSKIVVTQTDGSFVTLALYQNLPFLLVTKEVKNPTSGEIDIAKANPATFTLDLGKPAAELKTMGTGGLLAVDKNPGSYFFLSVADPVTRR
jgi:hypothetical protein